MEESKIKKYLIMVKCTLMVNIVTFLFKMLVSAHDTTYGMFFYYKLCLSKFYNSSICENYKDKSGDLDNTFSYYFGIYQIIYCIIPIIIVPFSGTWSDKRGRKLPLLLPFLGGIASSCFYIILESIPNSNSLHPLILLVPIFIESCTGKHAVFNMSINSYISDIREESDRTNAYGLNNAANAIGKATGAALAGLLMAYVSYRNLFIILGSLYIISSIITAFGIQSNVPQKDNRNEEIDKSIEKEKTSRPFNRNCFKNILDYFMGPINTLKAKRKQKTLKFVICLLVVGMLQSFCFVGQEGITILFLKRDSEIWTPAMYGYLVSTGQASMAIGSIFIIWILAEFLKMKDINIMILGIVFDATKSLMVAFSNTTLWVVFFAFSMKLLGVVFKSTVKSMLSKFLAKDELGQIYALYSLGRVLSGTMGTIVYLAIYSATVSFFPGFAFCADASIYVLCTFLLIWLACEISKSGDEVPTVFLTKTTAKKIIVTKMIMNDKSSLKRY